MTYVSFDQNLYYNPPAHLDILFSHDWAGAYQFDIIVVWKDVRTGEIRAAHDTGCSCPTPFEQLLWEDCTTIDTVDQLKGLVDLVSHAGTYDDLGRSLWDLGDPNIADLKATVHKALSGE